MFESLFKVAGHLEKGLDASVLRNNVINNNIANAETPGFKSSSVVFEEYYQKAIAGGLQTKTTREKHYEFSTSIGNVTPTIVENYITNQRMDDNNVDIDFQNAELAKNQLYFTALTEKLNGEYRRIRMAIREGG